MAGTQSVLRALDMLDAFSDERPAWTVTELAEATGLNRTTTYRLLTALESREYVARDEANDTYRLGSGLIALGGRALRANAVRAISRAELEQLAEDMGETATLEILSGPEVVIIDEVPGDYVTSGSQHIGSRWPAYATSTGKAILAHLPPAERAPALPSPLRPLTPLTLTDLAGLEACFEASRRLGYAVANEELELGFVAVGAPIFDADGRPVAAISLGGTLIRLSPERVPEVGARVQAAARRISHQLGYRTPQRAPSVEGEL
jgi:DNA-binding IclR family transcriptional regulator